MLTLSTSRINRFEKLRTIFREEFERFEKLDSRATYSQTVLIAGLPVRVTSGSADFSQRFSEYFTDYITNQSPVCDLIALVRHEHFEDANLWADANAEFEDCDGYTVQRDFIGRRITRKAAIALLSPGHDDAIHNFMRWFLSRVLVDHRRILLHGAGVVHAPSGEGFVFFGHSGAGKSTATRLIVEADRDVIALGDDAVILELRNSHLWLHSAPLGAGYTRLAPPLMAVPLGGIFRLHQDSNNKVEKLSKSEATTELFASTMFCGSDDYELRQRFDLVSAIAVASPEINRLHFVRDSSFWTETILRKIYGKNTGN